MPKNVLAALNCTGRRAINGDMGDGPKTEV